MGVFLEKWEPSRLLLLGMQGNASDRIALCPHNVNRSGKRFGALTYLRLRYALQFHTRIGIFERYAR